MFWPGQKKTQKQVLVALVILETFSFICSMFYGWHQMSKFKWSNLSYLKFIFEQPGKCEIKCYCNIKIIVNTSFLHDSVNLTTIKAQFLFFILKIRCSTFEQLKLIKVVVCCYAAKYCQLFHENKRFFHIKSFTDTRWVN